MTTVGSNGWLRVSTWLLGLGLMVAAGRLAWIQAIRPDLSGSGRWQVYRHGLRGRILDRNRAILALSQTVYTLKADPGVLAGVGPDYVSAMAPLLGVEAGVLAAAIDPVRNVSYRPRRVTNELGQVSTVMAAVTNRSVVIRRKVSPWEWDEMRRRMVGVLGLQRTNALEAIPRWLPRKQYQREKRQIETRYRQIRLLGITEESEELRVYPQGGLAAHVVGLVTNAPETAPVGLDMPAGVMGIERECEELLQGRIGVVRTQGVRHREFPALRDLDLAALAGMNVVLTIDATIQSMVERAAVAAMERMQAKTVVALVSRARTGEILAMASLPGFVPGQPAGDSQFVNYATQVRYEPGSVFKIFSYASVFQERVARMEERVSSDGGYWRQYRVGDSHPKAGLFDLEEAFGQSLNTVAAKLAMRIRDTHFVAQVRRFGFGSPTGIRLGWEEAGVVKDPAQRPGRSNTLTTWDGFTQSRMAYGYSVDVTPMQLQMAVGAIANGGDLMEPYLVKRIERADGTLVKEYGPQRRWGGVVRPDVIEQMHRLMKYVVSNGTGSKARLDSWTVAGKTGTSRRARTGARGYGDQYFGTFTGFLPAEDPQLVITVVLFEPTKAREQYYGGTSAAPVFAEIAAETASYLGIRPSPRPATNTVAELAWSRNPTALNNSIDPRGNP